MAWGADRGRRATLRPFFIVTTTPRFSSSILSGLEGALRAFSFIGLGLALIGIGLVYQKLVFAPARDALAPTGRAARISARRRVEWRDDDAASASPSVSDAAQPTSATRPPTPDQIA